MSTEDELELEMTSPSPTSMSLPIGGDENVCLICNEKLKQPKVLSCLHVFCEECLVKQVHESPLKSVSEDGLSPLGAPIASSITCDVCKQETKLTANGVSDLTPDYALSDMMDMAAIKESQMVCTSCKAKEKAVARCSDCANFLCPNCVTAHQYMRCFENHKVVTFEEMDNGEGLPIHKPIFCPTHPSENLKFYCNTCQEPICNECMVGHHQQPAHHHERISDIEKVQVDEIRSIVTESRGKMEFCEESIKGLDNALSELESQTDHARGLINETFQSYKAVLEKRKDDLLMELDALHTKHELSIMDLIESVGKTIEKTEDACKFTELSLKHGTSLQMLMLKRLVTSQLLYLINNTPKPEININIEFHTDANHFEEIVKKAFGMFGINEPLKVDNHGMSLQSSFEGEPFVLPPGLANDPVTTQFLSQLSTVTPASMPSSITGIPGMPDIESLASLPPGVMLPQMTGSTTSIPDDRRCMSRNSQSPAMSDSGISLDVGTSGAHANLAALTKLGTVGLNSQGQVTLNGHVMSALNLNTITHADMVPPVGAKLIMGAGAGGGAMSNVVDNPLSSLMSPSGNRPTTPNLEILAGLLNPPSQMNGLGNLGSLGSLSGIGNLAGSIGSMGSMMQQTGGLGTASPLTMAPPNTFGSGSGSSSSPSSSLTGGLGSDGAPYPPVRRTGKMSAMQIRCKFGQLGPGKCQFNAPHGFCLGVEEDIIVADTNNHRIQVYEKTGDFKYQFGIAGCEEGQLWYPRKVAVMRKSGKFVICDRGKERSRMQLFTKSGHFIKKIAIRYIDIVAGLAITQEGNIVAVDSVSPTVFCISESGELIKWFDCSNYMREPSDIAISGKDYFICDFKGHCVAVFNEEGKFLRHIGCQNITNYPNGIDISDAGDVLIGDSHGNRFHVAVFQRDGTLIGEFECPYVKVSRCCGLKITSEGYIVTLAKNNHHVLVLNTLYIT